MSELSLEQLVARAHQQNDYDPLINLIPTPSCWASNACVWATTWSFVCQPTATVSVTRYYRRCMAA